MRRPNSPFANDPFFQQFFGNDEFFGGRARPEQSLGSGVVISADGYIVTNNHVIAEGDVHVTAWSEEIPKSNATSKVVSGSGSPGFWYKRAAAGINQSPMAGMINTRDRDT